MQCQRRLALSSDELLAWPQPNAFARALPEHELQNAGSGNLHARVRRIVVFHPSQQFEVLPLRITIIVLDKKRGLLLARTISRHMPCKPLALTIPIHSHSLPNQLCPRLHLIRLLAPFTPLQLILHTFLCHDLVRGPMIHLKCWQMMMNLRLYVLT
jgi:hypothetical protein